MNDECEWLFYHSQKANIPYHKEMAGASRIEAHGEI